MAVSIALVRVLENELGKKLTDFTEIVLGHSLGEYTALACCDRISLKDCSLILKKRGELMNTAIAPNETGMAALIGKKADLIQKIIDTNNLNIEIANDNSNIQIVISGNMNEIKKSKKIFLNNGGALSSVSSPDELLKNTSDGLKLGLNSSNPPSVSRVELNLVKPCTLLGKSNVTLSKSTFTHRLYGIDTCEKPVPGLITDVAGSNKVSLKKTPQSNQVPGSPPVNGIPVFGSKSSPFAM